MVNFMKIQNGCKDLVHLKAILMCTKPRTPELIKILNIDDKTK